MNEMSPLGIEDVDTLLHLAQDGLCDARILSIFEGAAEIQAQVIARGLVSRLN